ncbi:hypothetical protein P9443_08035 [Peribacillus frigoritolerans]|uniref:hypothetical protein n=1 Tax=Peribacillus frigoritolerans TaxID=450367 RepID=UPI002E22B31F|nr:hypothetical protein [Peribacillus frigoritolerans]
MDTLIKQARVVGLKYAKMEKQYKDMLFPFHRDGEPTHTLITLANMGGKGVLLQAIFQLIEPLIRWGKEGRMVDSFFFKEKQKFAPYTFHVLIEWLVGNAPHTKLLTGIAVSAKPKLSNKNHGSPIDLEYVLYVVEQNEQTPFDIASIPLWNEETQTSLPLDDLKIYLKRHESHIKTYHRGQKKEYLTELKNYGIDPMEWRILKSINKDEGDVSAFFSRANDNFGLMANILIPTIDKQIEPEYKKQYYEKKSLAETFKDVAIANQEMPKLLERELTYAIIKDELTPVSAYLKRCADLERDLQRHRQNGYIIKEFMKKQVETKMQVAIDFENDLQAIEAELLDLKWDSANLEYAKAYQKAKDLEEQIEKLSEKYDQSIKLLAIEKEFVLQYKVKLKLFERNKLRRERALKVEKSNELKRLLEIDDIENEMILFKENLKNKWIFIQEKWLDIYRKHINYITRLSAELDLDNRELQKTDDKLSIIKKSIIQCETRMTMHEEKKPDLISTYGEGFVEDSFAFKENLMRIQTELNLEYKKLKSIHESSLTEKDDLLQKKGETSTLLNSLEEKFLDLDGVIMQRENEEEALINDISNISKERIDSYSKEVLVSSINSLEKDVSLTQTAIESSTREHWQLESQFDLLKDSNHWIPNKDLVIAKEHITSQGISCELGMEVLYEMLQNLGETLTRKEIEKHPLLPYSLVVYSVDMENIDLSFLENQYFQSPILLIPRDNMKQHIVTIKQEDERLFPTQTGTFLMVDAWLQQSLDLHAFEEKKKEIDRKSDDFLFLVEQHKSHLEKLQHIIVRCKDMVNAEDSVSLKQKRIMVENELTSNRSLLTTIKEQLSEMDEEARNRSNRMENIQNEKVSVTENIKAIEAWIISEKDHKNQMEKVKNYNNELNLHQETKNNLTREINFKSSKRDSYKESFNEWKRATEEPYRSLRNIFNWVKNPLHESLDPSVTDLETSVLVPDYSEDSIDDLNTLLFTYNKLNTQIETKNFEIMSIANDIRHIDTDILQLEEVLTELDSKWTQLVTPSETKQVIKRSIESHTKNVEEFMEQSNKLDKQRTFKNGLLEAANADIKKEVDYISKLSKLKIPEIWADIDLLEKEKEIKRNKKLTKEYKADTLEQRNANQEMIRILNTNISQLEDLDLEKIAIRDFEEFEWLGGFQENYQQKTSMWTKEFTGMTKDLKEAGVQFKAKYEEYRRKISAAKEMDKDIVSKVEFYFEDIITQDYLRMYEGVTSIFESFEAELQKLKENKNQGLKVLEKWTDRASFRVDLIVRKMKQMVSKMKITNYNNHTFHLVKYPKNYQFNEGIKQYNNILTDFFIQVLDDLNTDYDNEIRNVPLYEIEKRIDVSILVLKALNNQYPTLYVYNPGGNNHLLYEKEKDSYYSDWETIITGGEYAEASGSGGQKLMTQMIIMAMLMKSNKKGWSVLISDNPFSKMVSEPVVTPVFAICELLKIQWIVLSPPELTSTVELTRRFPIIQRLSFDREKGKEYMLNNIQMNIRVYIDKENILNEKRVASE